MDVNNVHSSCTQSRSNITEKEEKALKSLRKNTNYIIKPADKGGAVVVWRRDLYIAEAERQLNNPTFYEKVDRDPTSDHNQIVKDTVTDLIRSNALPSSASNLCQKSPRVSTFYLLPKIHKEGNPGRPIVSTIGCPTELISQYLDGILSPLVAQLDTYVKDSSDALRIFETLKLSAQGPQYLFTMDVSSLYTIIPQKEGLQAIQHFLQKFPSPDRADDTTILRLAELVLGLSTFQFNGNFYHQKKGVAMGTKMGPSYACLFIGFIEEQIIRSFQGPKPLLLKRYTDDYVGVASCSLEHLNELINHFNNSHNSLKFTHAISADSIAFLDIELSLEGDRIKTSVHFKPTDAHCYLNYSSSHPPSYKRSIPFSQLTRLRCLCSDDEDFQQKSHEMAGFFERRGYPEQVVKKATRKVSSLSRQEALEPRRQRNSDRVPLVLTYHPSTQKLVSTTMDNTHILQEDASTKEIFKEPPLVAYKKDRSLRDLLFHTGLKVQAQSEADLECGTQPCGRRRCNTCNHVDRAAHIKGPKYTWVVRDRFTCTVENVVYAITCTACHKIYIGETKRRLADRATEHLRSVRLNTPGLPVAQHFNRPGHTINHLKIGVMTTCHNGPDEKSN
ncbi:uncharacterized protein [Diadema setosum]|uniref:uncharacterized protein n=1 Tax=Diadema setosum TaxID=31175 RepID=UPI003B3ABECB